MAALASCFCRCMPNAGPKTSGPPRATGRWPSGMTPSRWRWKMSGDFSHVHVDVQSTTSLTLCLACLVQCLLLPHLVCM